jgi:hypothetical protein
MVKLAYTIPFLSLLASAFTFPVDDRPTSGPKAIYFLSNLEENSVISLSVGSDGTLSEGSTTSTGGMGARGINGMTNQPSGPDALFSQSSVSVVGNVCNLRIPNHYIIR